MSDYNWYMYMSQKHSCYVVKHYSVRMLRFIQLLSLPKYSCDNSRQGFFCISDSIKRLKSQLSDIIEPDFGLLDELVILGVLTLRELGDVQSERTVYRRNDALLDLLTSDEHCDKLLTALHRTQQEHVVNFVKENGGK